MKLLVTGGAGFIGSAVIRHVVRDTTATVVNLDKLTYAGNLESLAEVSSSSRYFFEQVDICDAESVKRVFEEHAPDAIMHLAAETHVDRSILGPAEFVTTNLVGTYVLLDVARHYHDSLSGTRRAEFRFHHISTDEVYGDLEEGDDPFCETTPYAPSSPYSASKAGSDHLVRAWGRTYGLPVLVTNCSNNYGPYQFPEKLIPLMICSALEGKALPVYGAGDQVRDWLYVEDHARALVKVVSEGRLQETYNIGGDNEVRNIDVVRAICAILEDMAPDKPAGVEKYVDLVRFVEDRPGHDRRYAIDSRKIEGEIDWRPVETFDSGLKKTVAWYLANAGWVANIKSGAYRNWMQANYGDRAPVR